MKLGASEIKAKLVGGVAWWGLRFGFPDRRQKFFVEVDVEIN